MDSKNKYLDFYKENFGQGKYCSKSWGLASYEAGQQSKQAEVDELREMVKKLIDNTVLSIDDELEDKANNLLGGNQR